MLSCFDVAEYFLAKRDSEAGDTISNMKLQKLLYYAQGFHLALHNEPLFDEPIVAWVHGPVVPALYHKYKEFGADNLPTVGDIDWDKYAPSRGLLDEVHEVFGQFSAWKLRNMTHDEKPWKDAEAARDVISHAAMAEYFKGYLVKE
jgi:uncharacterized phage-associated protein